MLALSKELSFYKNVVLNLQYFVDNTLSQKKLAMHALCNISFDWIILVNVSPKGTKNIPVVFDKCLLVCANLLASNIILLQSRINLSVL